MMCAVCTIRGLAEENTQLGIIPPIGNFKSQIADILFNWGLGICSLALLYQTHISPIQNWVYYLQLGIGDWRSPIGNNMSNWGIFSVSSLLLSVY